MIAAEGVGAKGKEIPKNLDEIVKKFAAKSQKDIEAQTSDGFKYNTLELRYLAALSAEKEDYDGPKKLFLVKSVLTDLNSRATKFGFLGEDGYASKKMRNALREVLLKDKDLNVGGVGRLICATVESQLSGNTALISR
jgi:hypothetical protein